MWIGPLILGALSLWFGVASGVPETFLVARPPGRSTATPRWRSISTSSGRSTRPSSCRSSPSPWASCSTSRDRIRALLARIIDGSPLKFDPGWDRTLDGLKALAEWQTRILQSGVLQRYMVIIFVTLAIGMGGRSGQGCARPRRARPGGGIRRPGLQALGGARLHHRGRASDRLHGSRMTAVAALGVVGIGVALIFIMFSAPDVAITQLLVETLTVVLGRRRDAEAAASEPEPGGTPPRPRGAVARRGDARGHRAGRGGAGRYRPPHHRLFRDRQLARGLRAQHRQRDPRGLPRPRHVRRDRRRRDRRACGLRAPARHELPAHQPGEDD
jgi:hypothetical protein